MTSRDRQTVPKRHRNIVHLSTTTTRDCQTVSKRHRDSTPKRNDNTGSLNCLNDMTTGDRQTVPKRHQDIVHLSATTTRDRQTVPKRQRDILHRQIGKTHAYTLRRDFHLVTGFRHPGNTKINPEFF